MKNLMVIMILLSPTAAFTEGVGFSNDPEPSARQRIVEVATENPLSRFIRKLARIVTRRVQRERSCESSFHNIWD